MTEARGPFAYRVSEDEVAVAAQAFMRKRLWQPPGRYLLIVVIVLSLLLLVLDLLDGMLNLVTLGLLLAAPVILTLALRVMAPRIARRQYRQSAALRDEHTLTFDDESITFAGTRGSATFPLAELYAFTETPGLLLVHQTEGFYNPIPKAALGEENAAALAEALRKAGVTQW